MKRHHLAPRANWLDIVVEQGLIYEDTLLYPGDDRRPYWDESVYYSFEMDEVLLLETQVELLHSLCLDAIDHVIATERFRDFGIPEFCWQPIVDSWNRHDPHLYGRFDLRYDGQGSAKLLEYNADTPTTLLEASVIQWQWKQAVLPDHDQWNSIHERLVDRWKELGAGAAGSRKLGGGGLASSTVHFTWTNLETTGEDHLTTAYLQETAAEAGLDTIGLAIEDLGWDGDLNTFVDLAETPIDTLFKLYPWEWLVNDPFGANAIRSLPRTRLSGRDLSAAGASLTPMGDGQNSMMWIEPLWKMLLSNKAILAVLWQLNPGHPSLLPAYLDDPGPLTDYIRKPKLGREGANVTIVTPDGTMSTSGDYGEEGYVYQAFHPLPDFEGQHPVLGAWMVGDESVGLGIRESVGLVTDQTSSFIPHVIVPD
ncbi:glutathionylspermidine synthase family protein [soil metagenome]